MTTLVLDGVSKRFGGVIAAEQVTMDIPAGKITGLVGPNGAGKSTIVNLITGMLPVSSGSICFGTLDLTREPAYRVGKAGIARTFQNIRLLRETTVLENIMIGFHRHQDSATLACLLGLPSARRETRYVRESARALLDRFGMSRFAEHPAGSLAYGHQRRVEMMRALAASPKLLLLDEPVAGMNDVEAHELGLIFEELAAEGMGVMLIEHNIRFVTRLCPHVFVLDGGRIISSGHPKAVFEDPVVVQAYLGA